MNKSDSIAKLATALVRVQAELKPVFFDAVNPFLHNQYATLGAVIEASVPVLNRHGLAITQLTTSGINQVGVTTVLLHESGEYIETTTVLNLDSNKGKSLAQEAGSTITYLRRYSWAAILGLYAEEDTDGNGNGTEQRESPKVKTPDEKPGFLLESDNKPWGAAVINTVIKKLPKEASNPQEAITVLELSNLPTDVPSKTLNSWLNHVKKGLDADSPLFDAVEAANNAYKAATGGK